jgi:hypothetical protein
MAVKFTNNAKTTLASGINSSVTTATVTDGSVFPTLGAGEHFYCTFDDGTNNEIVKVTARSGNTLTIVRGVDNTTARAFASGDAAELRATSALLTDIQENIAAKSANQTVYNTTTASSATDYDIGIDPSVEANAMVFLNGVMQHHDTFSFSGSTLTFDAAPPNGMALEVIVDNLINLQSSNLTVDTFTAADVGGNPQTDFTLSDAPAAEDNLLVFIDGVFQDQDAYTISNQTLTITDGVTADFGVTVYVINPVNIGTPSDGTVTSSKLSGNITMPADLTVTGDVAFDSPTFVVDNANSRVGIGTASPSTLLDIVGDVKMSANLTVDTSTLVVDATNNRVGIGTTSPSRTLDVRSAAIPANLQSTSTAGVLIDLKHAGTAASNVGAYNGIRFYNGDGFKMAMSHITEASGSGYLQFGTNWAADTGDVMAIHSSGNVGIGTTSPSAALNIVNAGLSTQFRVSNTESDATTKYGAIVGSHYTNAEEPITGMLMTSSSSVTGGTVSIGGGISSTNAVNNILFYTAANNTTLTGSEAMRIDSSGRVGIGTTSPEGTLHVENASNNSLIMDAPANRYNSIGFQTAGVDKWWLGRADSDLIAGDAFFIGIDNGNLSDAGGFSSKLVIDTSGNVGIGTSSPSEKLEISGAGNQRLQITETGSSAEIQLVQTNFGFGGLSAISPSGNNEIVFNVTASGTTSEIMRLDSSGNVGIGTDSPSVKLDVRSSGTSAETVAQFGNNNIQGGLQVQTNGNLEWGFNALNSRNLTFSTNQTERMRIDSSGRLMVNQTSVSAASAGNKMQVAADLLSTGSLAGFFWENRSGMTIASQSGWGGWYSTSTASHFLYSDGANRASIGRTSGTYTALSDVNKKKDFEDSTVGLAEVMQLKPKKFRMLDDADDAPKKLGFIAQDVENVIPEAYVEDTNEDASGVENTFIGLTDRPIIAALTKAIQEQQAQIETLKQEIREIKESG